MYWCPHFFPVNCNICLRSVTEIWLSWNSAQHRQISTFKHMCWPCSVLKTSWCALKHIAGHQNGCQIHVVCVITQGKRVQCSQCSCLAKDFRCEFANGMLDWLENIFQDGIQCHGAGSTLPFPGGIWLPTLVFSISAAMKLSRVKTTHKVLIVCRSTLKMFDI